MLKPCNIRADGRSVDSLREIKLEVNYSKYAEGSCLVSIGNTVVLCNASIDAKVPHFIKGTGHGWVTAEYSMLPRATSTRTQREAKRGIQNGRTQEIQRLIGRSLRAAVDLTKLGESQIIVDCDVIQADGGTRTASITGGYVALYMAIRDMSKMGLFRVFPIKTHIAAVSCGIIGNTAILDLNYNEDSAASVDANFVLDSNHNIIEMQCSAERETFTEENFQRMLNLAKIGVDNIVDIQKRVLNTE